jgi:ABC-type branched-subunit amino acid transport system substrate-binding protein
MHNDQATQMINRQIEIELRKLNSILTDEEDKPAIIQRVAELKGLVDASPTVKKTEQPTTRELIADFIQAIRHR